MAKEISIGDEVWVHGYVDEIRKDCIIIRNDGGYFETVDEEIGYCDEYEVLVDTPQPEADKACDRYAVVNDKGDKEYNCIGCGRTDCPWK